MPEKSSAAVQTVSSRPPIKVEKTENLFEVMDRLYHNIASRAYDLFERAGRLDGHDLDHWLQAERDFLHPVHIHMDETEKEFSVRAEVPGFTPKDVEVNIEPRRLTIRGKRESKTESKKGETVYAEQCSDEIFRSISLPAEVNTSNVTATLKDGVLDIQLPKAASTKPVKMGHKAA
jgi:HSP20 family molecular chaperone IbpA